MRRSCSHLRKGHAEINRDMVRLFLLGLDNDFEPPPPWHVEQPCRYGNCMELLCPVCGCYRGGWGPVDCPCEDWICWLDMRSKPRAPVKPSDRRVGLRRTAARRKATR